jgi:hypothetical protein
MNQFFATRWNLTVKPANKFLIIPRLDMQNICAIFWGNLAVLENDVYYMHGHSGIGCVPPTDKVKGGVMVSRCFKKMNRRKEKQVCPRCPRCTSRPLGRLCSHERASDEIRLLRKLTNLCRSSSDMAVNSNPRRYPFHCPSR